MTQHAHTVKVGARTYTTAPAGAAVPPDLSARVSALEAAVAALQPPAPLPVPAGRAVYPGEDVPALVAAGARALLLRGGVHRFAFGASERHEAGVSLLPYPGEPVAVDGTGLDQHFLYLGPGASWTLGAIALRGFAPANSGIVAVGDDCSLVTLPGFSITGPGARGDSTSHGVYLHGTGSALLDRPAIAGVPGAAVQAYRGAPVLNVVGGRLGGVYTSALVYSGAARFEGTAFTEAAAAWDVRASGARPVLSGCTGTGPSGAVRLFQD